MLVSTYKSLTRWQPVWSKSRGVLTKRNMYPVLTYEQAINTLNSLQSNATAIQCSKERIQNREECKTLQNMKGFLSRAGIQPEDLHKLSVIHVAGTKGKGTTSAFCESILRRHGYRTGFYSSPHLISVTERIRLNGRSITKEDFAYHFSRVYKDLYETQEFDGDMPMYFCFLTVMAFKVFLEEKVDVAVVEVGIGGRFDYTNVVTNVPAIGITSLGLDHTAILGNTIEQIAAEKGGVMKPGCEAYTVLQPPGALQVLRKVAFDTKCPLNIVPNYDAYSWMSKSKPALSADLPSFKMNASLAVQLAHAWMRHHGTPIIDDVYTKQLNNGNTQISDKISKTNGNDLARKRKLMQYDDFHNGCRIEDDNDDGVVIEIPQYTSEGIETCSWPGRCQVLKKDLLDFYIDGAHTTESIDVCISWFKHNTRKSSNKILIFNMTGDRDSEALLKCLVDINFNLAIFVPNVPFAGKTCIDMVNVVVNKNSQMKKCEDYMMMWNSLVERNYRKSLENISEDGPMAKVFCSVSEAIDHIKLFRRDQDNRPQILVTGSLHLVGAALAVLDPELTQSEARSFDK